MAADRGTPLRERFARINDLTNARKIALMLAFAVSIAAVFALWLATGTREYRPLYADMSGRDGAAIRAALDTAGIPYRTEPGGLLSVPAARLNEAHTRLSAEGLPKGTSAGFELLDNVRFGASQFTEQVKYQRALEGELKRSIELVEAVRSARVHLAIPRPSAFLRDQQAPSASVLLTLHSGRTLDAAHVAGIVQLVASSVTGLTADRVAVVDSTGALLKAASGAGSAQRQPDFAEKMELDLVRRVEGVLAPLVGPRGARVQAHAEMEPQLGADDAVLTDSTLATQDDSPATTLPTIPAPSAQPSAPTLRRLAVSVILDHKRLAGSSPRPWTAAELAQVTALIRNAMGFSAVRGDTLNVVNTPFAAAQQNAAIDLPWWREPAMAELGRELLRYGSLLALVIFLVLALVRPLLRELGVGARRLEPLPETGGSDYRPTPKPSPEVERRDPRQVANVIKTWMRDDR